MNPPLPPQPQGSGMNQQRSDLNQLHVNFMRAQQGNGAVSGAMPGPVHQQKKPSFPPITHRPPERRPVSIDQSSRHGVVLSGSTGLVLPEEQPKGKLEDWRKAKVEKLKERQREWDRKHRRCKKKPSAATSGKLKMAPASVVDNKSAKQEKELKKHFLNHRLETNPYSTHCKDRLVHTANKALLHNQHPVQAQMNRQQGSAGVQTSNQAPHHNQFVQIPPEQSVMNQKMHHTPIMNQQQLIQQMPQQPYNQVMPPPGCQLPQQYPAYPPQHYGQYSPQYPYPQPQNMMQLPQQVMYSMPQYPQQLQPNMMPQKQPYPPISQQILNNGQILNGQQIPPHMIHNGMPQSNKGVAPMGNIASITCPVINGPVKTAPTKKQLKCTAKKGDDTTPPPSPLLNGVLSVPRASNQPALSPRNVHDSNANSVARDVLVAVETSIEGSKQDMNELPPIDAHALNVNDANEESDAQSVAAKTIGDKQDIDVLSQNIDTNEKSVPQTSHESPVATIAANAVEVAVISERRVSPLKPFQDTAIIDSNNVSCASSRLSLIDAADESRWKDTPNNTTGENPCSLEIDVVGDDSDVSICKVIPDSALECDYVGTSLDVTLESDTNIASGDVEDSIDVANCAKIDVACQKSEFEDTAQVMTNTDKATNAVESIVEMGGHLKDSPQIESTQQESSTPKGVDVMFDAGAAIVKETDDRAASISFKIKCQTATTDTNSSHDSMSNIAIQAAMASNITTNEMESDMDWDIMFMQLKEYKRRFGNLQVPEPNESEKHTKQDGWYDVYVWVERQREKYSIGTLTYVRMTKLQELGLNFHPRPLHSYKKVSPRKATKRKSITNKDNFLSPNLKFQQNTLLLKPQTQATNKQPNNNGQEKHIAPINSQHLLMHPPYQQFDQNPSGGKVVSRHNMQQQMLNPILTPVQYGMNPVAFPPWGYNQNAYVQQVTYQSSHYKPFDGLHPHMQQATQPYQAIQYPQFNNDITQSFSSVNNTVHRLNQQIPQKSDTSMPGQQHLSGTHENQASNVVKKTKELFGSSGSRKSKRRSRAQEQKKDVSGHNVCNGLENKDAQPKKRSRLFGFEKKSKHTKKSKLDPKLCDQSTEDSFDDEKPKSNHSEHLHMGTFTSEEISYCVAVIRDWKRGYLDALPGANISKYLSKKLKCTYLRITKRFPSIVHLKPFAPVEVEDDDDDTEEKVDAARKQIRALYKKYQCSIGKFSKKKTSISAEDIQVPSPQNVKELEVETKGDQAMYQGNQSNLASAMATTQPNNNFMMAQQQQQMPMLVNPLATILQAKVLEAQFQANENYLMQQLIQQVQHEDHLKRATQEAQNDQLVRKAQQSAIMAQYSQTVATEALKVSFDAKKNEIESKEKDDAAAALCQLFNNKEK